MNLVGVKAFVRRKFPMCLLWDWAGRASTGRFQAAPHPGPISTSVVSIACIAALSLAMVKQKLRERYIDKNLLDRLLRGLFGNGNFEIEVLYLHHTYPIKC
jgi:hypothetical protein